MSQSTESPNGGRTILGVVVHVLGLMFAFIGAGTVYLLADDEFTKANARNSLNWWVFVFGAGIAIAVVGFGIGAVIDGFLILAALLAIILGFAGIAFSVWATLKAASGETWKYPLAPDLF